MKKFQFRLETVMNVYKINQDQAQATLQERISVDNNAKAKLQECTDALESGADLLAVRHEESQTVAELLQHRLFLSHLNDVVNQQKQVCMQTQQEVVSARDELVEASKRTRIIENLREKQYKQYVKEVLKTEQAFADEIGSRKKIQGL